MSTPSEAARPASASVGPWKPRDTGLALEAITHYTNRKVLLGPSYWWNVRNPFQYGAELRPSQIVNRKSEIRDVTRAIMEQGRLFLLGPRRFGKTAILRAASGAAERQGAVVIRLDAEAYPGVDGLVRAIVLQSASKLKSDVAKAGEKILRVFSRLRPVISYDPAENSWSGSLNAQTAADPDQTPLFIDAIDGLARLAAESRQPTAMVIDEFQKVIELGGESTEAQIRAAIQRHTEVAFIFAGSKTTLLNDMTLNPARPFYRLGIRHFLGPLPREEFAQFITRGFEGGKYRVESSAVKEILDAAEDVPYNVQALSSVAWELMADEDEATLTPKLVGRALKLLVERDGPFYLTVWNGLTTVQQRVLAAAIHEGGVAMTSASVTQRCRIASSTMSKTLKFLEARQILRREEQKATFRWRLEDPFFAAWLRSSA
ncbi:MAG TPA: AAA family ATPase [Steroidobacteraceae bacterium]|nr:AAA family ATPase [Steroidobacteraceae bacterium]